MLETCVLLIPTNGENIKFHLIYDPCHVSVNDDIVHILDGFNHV